MLNFQLNRVRGWLWSAFGIINPKILTDIEERSLRLGEEVVELTQTAGATREQWHRLVDQVFDKEVGDPFQELGGVLVTLAAFLAVTDLRPDDAFETELARIEDPAMMARIRHKHATKAVVSSQSLDGVDGVGKHYGAFSAA